MSLGGSLLIGQSALTASQIALQVAGNNIANAATPGYHRQVATMSTVRGNQINSTTFVGRGVQVAGVNRAIDEALVQRLRNARSETQAALTQQQAMGQIESLLNELSGSDLSTQLSEFFNAFSEMANAPGSTVTRSTVVEQGAALSSFIREMRTQLTRQQNQVDTQIRIAVERADTLLGQVAELNTAITDAELGGLASEEGNLRDQRDAIISELADMMDITVIEQDSGAVDILVGSTPVVFGGVSRGLTTVIRNVDGEPELRVATKVNQEEVGIESGRIGGFLAQRDGAIGQTIESLDNLASALIFEVNKAHTQGRPGIGLTNTTGWLRVAASDQSLALNDPDNETLADLPYGPSNGSFRVVVTDQAGNRFEQLIQVDLDGIDSTGAAGYSDDMSMQDLRDALNAVPNLNAEITPGGQLRVYTDNGFEVSFRDDTSGVLAVFGINTYFQGADATDIAIRQELRNDPNLLVVGHESGTNENALAIAGLRDASVQSLSGDSLTESWLKTVDRVAVQTNSANAKAEALRTVQQSLEAQQAAVSGVSLDEEAINLINYQQQYQGAARFISVVNELTQVLLNLV